MKDGGRDSQRDRQKDREGWGSSKIKQDRLAKAEWKRERTWRGGRHTHTHTHTHYETLGGGRQTDKWGQ